VGLLGCQNSVEIEKLLEDAAAIKPTADRPYVAVASMEGLLVNRHLGEAVGLWIFGLENGKAALLEQRPTPPSGSGDRRWEDLSLILTDCFALLAANCGERPKRILEASGIAILAGEGLISETAGALLEGRKLQGLYTAGQCGRGTSCGGAGMGCA
jgi:nitrogen fixation protein NifB